MANLFVFDMGGVVSEHCFVWKQICRALGLQESDAAEKSSFQGLLHAMERGEISSMEMLEIIARREHLPPPRENYWASFFAPTLNGATVSLIDDLHKAGERVVCGTNTVDVHYAYHLAHNHYSCFDAVYASHLMEQVKPDQSFWYALRAAEQARGAGDLVFGDMVFFDDMEQNVAAAADLGIRACLFTGAEEARAFIARECGLVLAPSGAGRGSPS